MTDTSTDTQSVEGERSISDEIKSIEELSLEIISVPDVSIDESGGTSLDQHLLYTDLQNKSAFEHTLLSGAAYQSHGDRVCEDDD
jgi:hypothetical protein